MNYNINNNITYFNFSFYITRKIRNLIKQYDTNTTNAFV